MVKKLTHQLRSASINSLTITIKSQSNIYFATLAFKVPIELIILNTCLLHYRLGYIVP